MESLAVLVMILLLSAVLCGPIAYALTRVQVHSKKSALAKRMAVTLLALWGALAGFQFAISNLGFFPRVMGVVGVTISVLAVKREFIDR
ncbi:MAG: hypothetical protein Q8L08_10845 [Candidatus Nanopelagicaceae bacterium]|nr:hypothetical protein [Candidatus Nanopelagicaceae bacterium]